MTAFKAGLTKAVKQFASSKKLIKGEEDVRGDDALLGLTEPKLIALFSENAFDRAGLANAQAAVAVERWRLAHPGRLPDALSELVPAYLTAVPLDPFDGQPVRYKKLPVGYVVYSVGTGWTDQGERTGSAITLTVER